LQPKTRKCTLKVAPRQEGDHNHGGQGDMVAKGGNGGRSSMGGAGAMGGVGGLAGIAMSNPMISSTISDGLPLALPFMGR
jgi:hypothetical protein